MTLYNKQPLHDLHDARGMKLMTAKMDWIYRSDRETKNVSRILVSKSPESGHLHLEHGDSTRRVAGQNTHRNTGTEDI
jgi:hypothetical protein